MRGSPHLHALIWTSDCPKLTHENKEVYIQYIDKHVQACLPNKETDSNLYELVRTYQKHSHSKTCRKYKNIACRFNFGQFFTERTIVGEPLSDDVNEEIRADILCRRSDILSSVKLKIDELLDPRKANYNVNITDKDLLNLAGVSDKEYEWALSISGDSDYALHLKRSVDSCFINNYFVAGIKGFSANVDLQPVFNHYKCLTYICSYFSKDETECSQAISNAAKEARDSNLTVRDSLRKVGAAFLSTREVSAQECVYRCMPELWLRKTFPTTIFVSTSLPENRLRVAKSQNELDALDDCSTDIYKSNIIERYTYRPKAIVGVDRLCLAEFVAHYYKDYRSECSETNDAQPDVLTDNVIESQHVDSSTDVGLPHKIRLLNTNEVMKCRKVKAVIRFHTPSKRKEPEKYFHHLLMLYFPWRQECDLIGTEQTYISKFYEPDVQAVVEQNMAIFQPDAEAVAEALEFLRNNPNVTLHSYDSINDQENEDVQCQLGDNSAPDELYQQSPAHLAATCSDESQQTSSGVIVHNQPSDISDDLLRESVRSLNSKQRYAYDIVLSWCRTKMKSLNSLKADKVEPIHLFITGGAGSGKSHLIKAIYHTAMKTFKHAPVNPQLPTVLLMAPTGVAAINISGTTINTGLSIPKESGDNVPPLSDHKKTQLRMSLSELKLIIIDEISMVSNNALVHIHQRLKQIFATANSQLFAGISMIAVGDLYQLPPIRRKPIFSCFKNDVYNLCHPWEVFKMIELTEIMRQKDDLKFTQLLNRLRTASPTEDDIKCIQSTSITPSDDNYPYDALHIWAENAPVTEHNNRYLQQIPSPLFVLKAIDQYPQNVTRQDIERVLSKGRSETGGLDSEILMKENARVMLTANIDIADRLINGQMGTVFQIDTDKNTNEATIIYIKFDDTNAGKTLMNKSVNRLVKEEKVVPIVRTLAKIKVRQGKRSSPEIIRVQFPITLAWACTVHKVQGLTLNNVVVSFNLLRQKSFNYGQIYVALSRATSLKGMHILGKIEKRQIRSDPRVHEEYERLRNLSVCVIEPKVGLQNTLQNNKVLRICMLNIRSLRKHSIDLMCHHQIFSCDILTLTETHLQPNEPDYDIIESLHPFELHREDNFDKYSSLAVCYRNSIQISQYQYYSSINALRFVITYGNCSAGKMSIILLYRKHGSNIREYVNNIGDILNECPVDMILGDFNINYLHDKESRLLKILMNSLNYTQVVESATFVSSGSLLDHVYINPRFLKMINNSIISVYYSDHDAVKICISFI